MENTMRRVVVTGLGVISPVGNTVEACWNSLKSGVHGIGPITLFDTTDYKTKIAAEVKDFDPRAYMDKTEVLRSDAFSQYGVAAACQAVEESGVIGTLPPERVAVYFGSGIGGIRTFTEELINMQALSTSEDPNAACLPFDKRRGGFVIGEGGAALVLEEYEHAVKRGAKIYGEVCGYGATCDAFHITAPRPDGSAGARAIQLALQEAGHQAGERVYINAHGTGTPMNDSLETQVVKLALGEEEAKKAYMSSTKSMTGHMLGAAGAIEALACLKALNEGILPPTINLLDPDPACDLNYVPNQAIHTETPFPSTGWRRPARRWRRAASSAPCPPSGWRCTSAPASAAFAPLPRSLSICRPCPPRRTPTRPAFPSIREEGASSSGKGALPWCWRSMSTQ